MSAITYKCPNCDGGLIFDPESGNYACEYCLSKFTQDELMAESQSAETAQVVDDPVQETALRYRCPSCGAEVITDETTAATYCFYCHNPIVL